MPKYRVLVYIKPQGQGHKIAQHTIIEAAGQFAAINLAKAQYGNDMVGGAVLIEEKIKTTNNIKKDESSKYVPGSYNKMSEEEKVIFRKGFEETRKKKEEENRAKIFADNTKKWHKKYNESSSKVKKQMVKEVANKLKKIRLELESDVKENKKKKEEIKIEKKQETFADAWNKGKEKAKKMHEQNLKEIKEKGYFGFWKSKIFKK